MPFRSEAQRRFMYANHPDIAAKWEDKYGSKPRPLKRKSTRSSSRRTRR